MGKISVTHHINIDESEIRMDFIHSSGPGGQNVNKVASAVQLRFNVIDSPNLSREVKERFCLLAGKRVSTEGIFTMKAVRYRSQEKNRQDALNRLKKWIEKAAIVPKKRSPTKPTRSSINKRLEKKKQRGIEKQRRKKKEFPEN